jgi:predicted transcriptional regulator of viral defense system
MRKRQHDPASRSQTDRAMRMLGERGMVRRREFLSWDVAPETLARLVRSGRVTRVARGLYQKAGTKPSADHCLAEAAKLVPRGIVCLVSALQFHGLARDVPGEVWIAVPNCAWRPSIQYPPIQAVYFGPTAYTTAVQTHQIERVPVRIYGIAKTIVDCFRYRNKIGIETALSSLRTALAEQRCSAHEVLALAKELRIFQVVAQYLEATTR